MAVATDGAGDSLPAEEAGESFAIILSPSLVVFAEVEGGGFGGVKARTT